MSKFFQALEHADRERAAERAATATVATPDAPEPVPAAPVTAEPVRRPAASTTAPAAPYGAPVVRRRGGGHARTFLDTYDAAPLHEEGHVDDHLVSLLAPTALAAEQYRTVRLAIERHRREHGLHVVAISSPGRGDGKTVTAINVAGALAQAPDARVALVDADLRHPKVAEYLGLSPDGGLSAYVVEPTLDAGAVIRRPAGVGFAVVVAGAPSAMPYEILKSPRFATLLQGLRQEYDYVVVDTPPVLPFPDVGVLRDAVDGFILVVRANHTPREGVTNGLDTVGRHRLVGVVFNDDARHPAATADGHARAGWRDHVARRLRAVSGA